MAKAPQTQTGILALEGDIDMLRSPEVKQTLEPLIAQKVPRILVDFSAVTYIDKTLIEIEMKTLHATHPAGSSGRSS